MSYTFSKVTELCHFYLCRKANLGTGPSINSNVHHNPYNVSIDSDLNPNSQNIEFKPDLDKSIIHGKSWLCCPSMQDGFIVRAGQTMYLAQLYVVIHNFFQGDPSLVQT